MEQNVSLIWEKCLTFMKNNLNASETEKNPQELHKTFDKLFSNVRPISLIDGNLTLLVPSEFYKEYIEANYLNLMAAAFRQYIGKGARLWYSVMENSPKNQEHIRQNIRGTSAPAPTIQAVVPVPKETVNPLVVPGVKKIEIESNLNPDLSFDNYVEGESNRFASQVAKTIAQKPGSTAFNPLFIHGGVGVGKTHLAHAIGLEVKNNFPEKVVLYISSEKFIQHFMSAVRAKSDRTEFHNYYQMIDVLIIDDIQFLSGKAATQDSFFHIFDHLHQNGKQIILTSDKAPVDIQDIQERVVSRFKWGLSTEVKSPDLETRKSIIVDKLSRDGIVLTEDMLDYLAREVSSNVRELVGVINSVIAYSTIYKSDLSLDLLKETINKIASTQRKTINIPYIQEVVCDYFGIKREELLSKSRKRTFTLPRQLAMYFAKEYTNATYAKIGEEMGGRDHTTAIYAYDLIKDTAEVDKDIKKYVKELREKFA